MNIKLQISEVKSLIDSKLPLEQVYKQLRPLAQKADLQFIEPQIGHGYLQWSLPDNGWTSFGRLDEAMKGEVAGIYRQRKEKMASLLSNSPLKEAVLCVPSELLFVFVKQQGDEWLIALAGWGFRYPNKGAGRELEAYFAKTALQEVAIGFQWNGQLIPNYTFKIQQFSRTTTQEGWFFIDQPMPIGKHLQIKTLDGQEFTLVVIEHQKEYLYDLTQYFDVLVHVEYDDSPWPSCDCTLTFNEKQYRQTSDARGEVSLRIPFIVDEKGEVASCQPYVSVSCNGEREDQQPIAQQGLLRFDFSFHTPKEEPKEKEEPIKVIDKPLPPIVDPPTPEYVKITLRDFGGFPLVDMPITLITKKQGEMSLVTDKQGEVMINKAYFTQREKFRVKFEVTPEYRSTHDIHERKRGKKS